jgi:hypothetical protein
VRGAEIAWVPNLSHYEKGLGVLEVPRGAFRLSRRESSRCPLPRIRGEGFGSLLESGGRRYRCPGA